MLHHKNDVIEVIDQINADIVVYKKQYDNIVFGIYDTGGFIIDHKRFQEDIESLSPSVKRVIIIRASGVEKVFKPIHPPKEDKRFCDSQNQYQLCFYSSFIRRLYNNKIVKS